MYAFSSAIAALVMDEVLEVEADAELSMPSLP